MHQAKMKAGNVARVGNTGTTPNHGQNPSAKPNTVKTTILIAITLPRKADWVGNGGIAI